MQNLCAESLESLCKQIVRKRTRWRRPRKNRIDRSPDRRVDVKNDDFFTIAQKNSTTRRGWQQGHWLNSDKIAHTKIFVALLGKIQRGLLINVARVAFLFLEPLEIFNCLFFAQSSMSLRNGMKSKINILRHP